MTPELRAELEQALYHYGRVVDGPLDAIESVIDAAITESETVMATLIAEWNDIGALAARAALLAAADDLDDNEVDVPIPWRWRLIFRDWLRARANEA